jgi:type II secretory pathway pseudopilin PulG
VPWLAVACALASIAALVLAAWVWSAQSSARDTAARQAAQITQLRQALARAQSGSARSISGLAGQVSGMDSALNAMAPYSKICSTDLTGPNGPAEFFFQCTDQKPGG